MPTSIETVYDNLSECLTGNKRDSDTGIFNRSLYTKSYSRFISIFLYLFIAFAVVLFSLSHTLYGIFTFLHVSTLDVLFVWGLLSICFLAHCVDLLLSFLSTLDSFLSSMSQRFQTTMSYLHLFLYM